MHLSPKSGKGKSRLMSFALAKSQDRDAVCFPHAVLPIHPASPADTSGPTGTAAQTSLNYQESPTVWQAQKGWNVASLLTRQDVNSSFPTLMCHFDALPLRRCLPRPYSNTRAWFCVQLHPERLQLEELHTWNSTNLEGSGSKCSQATKLQKMLILFPAVGTLESYPDVYMLG